MEKISLPPEVVVSIASVNDLNPTPRAVTLGIIWQVFHGIIWHGVLI